jgi:type I restriction enzyme S subunit
MKSWPKVKLDSVCSSVDYGHTASATTEAVGPKFLRITDIQDGQVDWQTVPFCECSAADEASSRLKPGDIVFARTGATTGKSFLIRACPDRAVFASYLIRVRAGEKVLPPYLAHFFQTPSYWAQISRSSRGVAQAGVNATSLKTLELPLPPLDEQRRIAGILDAAAALRTKRREALIQLDELISSLFIERFGDPAHNRKSHKVVQLADVTSKITDGVHQKPNYVETGVPFISVKDITTGTLKFDDCKYITREDHEKFTKKWRPERGDILYTKVGATYGRPALVNTDREFSLYVSVCLLKPKHSLIEPMFLCSALRTSAVKRQADQKIKGIGVPDLHLDQIRTFLIPLPSLSEQRDFVAQLSSIEAIKTAQQRSLKGIDNLFLSLQHRAFRGEL